MAKLTKQHQIDAAKEQCEAIVAKVEFLLGWHGTKDQTLINGLISIRGMARHVTDGGSVSRGSPVPFKDTYTPLGG